MPTRLLLLFFSFCIRVYRLCLYEEEHGERKGVKRDAAAERERKKERDVEEKIPSASTCWRASLAPHVPLPAFDYTLSEDLDVKGRDS